jgi:ArsR family transcriptional regulator, arsenate/arsenite/antimonite-responsive transcriptional repressor
MVAVVLDKPKASSASCCESTAAPVIGEPEAEAYAGWFKALADPTRIRILNMLAQSDEPLCVCEIVDHFELGQPAISHHLKILRDVRFVLPERRGTFIYYRVNQACLAEFPDAARRILNQ